MWDRVSSVVMHVLLFLYKHAAFFHYICMCSTECDAYHNMAVWQQNVVLKLLLWVGRPAFNNLVHNTGSHIYMCCAVVKKDLSRVL